MKNKLLKLLCTTVAAAMLLSAFADLTTAQAATQAAATKYPIVLVHGAGFRDMTLFFINYWGRIPGALEANGARVFYGGTDAWGSIENNARLLQRRVDRVLAETGAEQVNIIAHSRGGVEARYMISSLGMASKVASLSTISTPHHGSNTIDVYLRLPSFLRWLIALPVNAGYFMLGDTLPLFHESIQSFSPSYMAEFNRQNPNARSVYYQSYAAQMTNVFSDFFLSPPFLTVSWYDGPNDGLVSVESAQWGTYRGELNGLSHASSVDYRRSRTPLVHNGNNYADITDFYVAMAAELKAMGF